jgi:hypothetical protein
MSVPAATATMDRLAAHLDRRARWRWPELVFWLGVLAVIFALPSRAAIINEALIAGLFALSLDLILGLTGIVSLGHAAFLGLGAYAAATLATEGFADPLLGLALGSGIAALVGLVTAPLLVRGGDLTRLMVTLGVSLMLGELANRNGWLTGGADGLNFSIAPDCSRSASPDSAMRRSTASRSCSFCSRSRAALRIRRLDWRWPRPAKIACAQARLASTLAEASSRFIRLRRPTRARRARCWRRRRRSCRSTCSTSIDRLTSC